MKGLAIVISLISVLYTNAYLRKMHAYTQKTFQADENPIPLNDNQPSVEKEDIDLDFDIDISGDHSLSEDFVKVPKIE